MSDPRPSWKSMDDEQCAVFIRTQMAAGKSFGDMAAMFCDTTRNAILGKRHRLQAKGIVFQPANPKGSNDLKVTPARARAVPARRSKPAQMPIAVVRKQTAAVAEVAVEAPADEFMAISKSVAFLPIPGIVPIPITDLPNRMRCRWPVETGEERHFACGAATVSENHVYCASHRRLSVRGAQSQGAY